MQERCGPLRLVDGQSDHGHIFLPAIGGHVARGFLAVAAGRIVEEQEDVALTKVVGLALDSYGCGHLDSALMHVVVAETRAGEYGDHYQSDQREPQTSGLA